MVAIKTALLVFVLVTTPRTIQKRDYGTIVKDIVTVDSNVKATEATITNWKGGVLSAIPILTAERELDDSVRKETTDAKASSSLTLKQANDLEILVKSM
jgi:hypothetical protein